MDTKDLKYGDEYAWREPHTGVVLCAQLVSDPPAGPRGSVRLIVLNPDDFYIDEPLSYEPEAWMDKPQNKAVYDELVGREITTSSDELVGLWSEHYHPRPKLRLVHDADAPPSNVIPFPSR